jgi:hydrogenase maturation protease
VSVKNVTMKIIGCGNPDRGDDQAGIAVSERLRELGFEAEAHTGDPLLLLEKWHADDDVILVDATSSGAPAGTVRQWDCEIPAVHGSGVSSHGFDVGKAIELAQVLHRLPTRLRVYGIEGCQFERGARVSPEVDQAIDDVVQRIAADAS